MNVLDQTILALRAALRAGDLGLEYRAALWALSRNMSDEAIGRAFEEAFGYERVIVENDLADTLNNQPDQAAVDGVVQRLHDAGWVEETTPPLD